MSRTVNITGQEIVIKEQDGQRVVTLNDIDTESHQCMCRSWEG